LLPLRSASEPCIVREAASRLLKRPRRLARPRTPPFHGDNTGSNPVGDAKHLCEMIERRTPSHRDDSRPRHSIDHLRAFLSRISNVRGMHAQFPRCHEFAKAAGLAKTPGIRREFWIRANHRLRAACRGARQLARLDPRRRPGRLPRSGKLLSARSLFRRHMTLHAPKKEVPWIVFAEDLEMRVEVVTVHIDMETIPFALRASSHHSAFSLGSDTKNCEIRNHVASTVRRLPSITPK
jgi:hypothetical protein